MFDITDAPEGCYAVLGDSLNGLCDNCCKESEDCGFLRCCTHERADGCNVYFKVLPVNIKRVFTDEQGNIFTGEPK